MNPNDEHHQDEDGELVSIPKKNVFLTWVLLSLFVMGGLWLEWKFGIISKIGSSVLSSIRDAFSKPSYDPGYLPTPTR